MSTFTSTARRADGWWIVQCDQFPAALSQVRRLEQAAEAQREAIAFVAELAPEDVAVTVLPSLPDDVLAAMTERATALKAAQEASERAASVSRQAVQQLHEAAGLSLRDVAQLLSVSLARASQLLSEAHGNARSSR